MPIYEYRCEACGTFEEMQRMSDPPLAKCPKCKRKVRRLMSSTSFQLKGTGWYVTDYARSGSGNGSKKDKGGDSGKAEGTADSKSESKSESKPESKAETKSEAKAESKSSASTGTTEKSSS